MLRILALLILGCFSATPFVRSQDCSAPPKVQTALNRQFPGWRITQLKDLVEDDQQLWKKAHPIDCPGIASGSFRRGGSSVAVLLIHTEGATHKQQLVLISEENAGQRFRVLRELPASQVTWVISKVPAGGYRDWTRQKHVHTERDGIYLEHIESTITLFYWRNGSFRTLVVSN